MLVEMVNARVRRRGARLAAAPAQRAVELGGPPDARRRAPETRWLEPHSSGGSQILVIDPSGNFVELFQPARRAK
jgi:hypothetical protein